MDKFWTKSNEMKKLAHNNMLVAWFCYVLLALITTYPLIWNMGALLGPPEDNQSFIWNSWWFEYSILNLHKSPFHTTYLFYPDGASLLFHTLSPLNCVMAVLIGTAIGPQAAQNLLIILTFIIGAIGGYYLGRYLGLGDSGAFICGLIFSFNPFHFAHAAHHLNISSIQFLPFLLLFSLKACRFGRTKDVILSALLLTANFYLCFYIFLISLFLLVCIPVISSRDGDYHFFKITRQLIYIFAINAALISTLLIPMISENLGGNVEKLAGHSSLSIDLSGFFLPHRYHWSRGSALNALVNRLYTANDWEAAAFLGYLVLPIAIWASIKSKFRLKKYFILVGLLGAILSLGSFPRLLGRSISFIKLPVWLFEHLPFLSAARTPSRFIMLTYFAIAVFAAYAGVAWLNYLKERWSKNIFRIGVVGLSAAIVLDYWSAPFAISKIQVPGYYREIKADAGEFAIMNLPLEGYSYNERYMYYQTVHNKPICGGQLSRSTDEYFKNIKNIVLTRENLTPLRIKYIILHKEFLEPIEYQKTSESLKGKFELIAEDETGSVFRTYH